MCTYKKKCNSSTFNFTCCFAALSLRIRSLFSTFLTQRSWSFHYLVFFQNSNDKVFKGNPLITSHKGKWSFSPIFLPALFLTSLSLQILELGDFLSFPGHFDDQKKPVNTNSILIVIWADTNGIVYTSKASFQLYCKFSKHDWIGLVLTMFSKAFSIKQLEFFFFSL